MQMRGKLLAPSCRAVPKFFKTVHSSLASKDNHTGQRSGGAPLSGLLELLAAEVLELRGTLGFLANN